MRQVKSLFIGLFLLVCTSVWASIPSPVETLEQVTNKMLAEIKKNKAAIKADKDDIILRGIVDRILLPYVDENRISRSVIARRDVWDNATKAQHKAFIDEFKELLIGTYAAALTNYNDQPIRYLPVRGEIKANHPLQVHSLVEQAGGPPIELDYRVIYRNDRWRVYDISVGGVSLVQNYKEQFAGILNQPDGMNKLIEQLKAHNDQN